jgi:hypothetical protein
MARQPSRGRRRADTTTRMGRAEGMTDVDGAACLAEEKLAVPLPRRWRHVRSVARRARLVAKELALPDDLEGPDGWGYGTTASAPRSSASTRHHGLIWLLRAQATLISRLRTSARARAATACRKRSSRRLLAR